MVHPDFLEEVLENLTQEELALVKTGEGRVELWRVIRARWSSLDRFGVKKVLDALIEMNGA